MSIASIKSIASIVLQVCPGSLVAACVSIANLQAQGKEKRRCRGAIQSAARGQMTSKTRAKRHGVRRGIAAFNAKGDNYSYCKEFNSMDKFMKAIAWQCRARSPRRASWYSLRHVCVNPLIPIDKPCNEAETKRVKA